MKPNFALNLSFDGIGLLHRRAGGWYLVGEAPLDATDLGQVLRYLRQSAVELEPGRIATKLVIPNSQIRYAEIEIGEGDPVATIRDALAEMTPYPIEELAFDWKAKGKIAQVAAVALETLEEAETFALEHRFNPVSFVAIPEAGTFDGEPFFGTTRAAHNYLDAGETVERDAFPLKQVPSLATSDPLNAPDAAQDAAAVVPEAPPEDGQSGEEAEAATPAVPPGAQTPDETEDARPSVGKSRGKAKRARGKSKKKRAEDEAAAPPADDAARAATVAETEEPAASAEDTPDQTQDTVAFAEDSSAVSNVDAASEEESVAATEDTEAEDAATTDAKRTGSIEQGEAASQEPTAAFGDSAAASEDTEAKTEDSPAPSEETSASTEGIAASSNEGEATADDTPALTEETTAEENIEAPTESSHTPPESPPASAEDVATSSPDAAREAHDTSDAEDDTPPPREEPTELPTEEPSSEPAVARDEAPADKLRPASGITAASAPDLPPPPKKSKRAEPKELADIPGLSSAAASLEYRSGKRSAQMLPATMGVYGEDAGRKRTGIVAAGFVAALVVLAVLFAFFMGGDGTEEETASDQDRDRTSAVVEAPEAPSQAEAPSTRTAEAPTAEETGPEPAAEAADTETAPVTAEAEDAAATPPAEAADLETAAGTTGLQAEDTEPAPEPTRPRAAPPAPMMTESNEPPVRLSSDSAGDIYTASVDRPIGALDAVALPEPEAEPGKTKPAELFDPAPAGTRFTLDESGRVIPSPDGVLNPNGIPVYSGQPSITPPTRPVVAAQPAEAADPDVIARLAGFTPVHRPDNLKAQFERARYGGLTRSELAGRRPPNRPEAPQDDEEVDSAPTALAISRSLLPRERPDDMQTIVAAVRARTPAPTAEPEPAQIRRGSAPSIPTRASVARNATIEGVFDMRRTSLVGVYGTSSNRRALVRTRNGRYHRVSVGDDLDGGLVSVIGASSLQYVKGGRSITLKMPEN